MNLRALLGGSASAQPIEVGTVSWNRELTDALSKSRQSNKPVFALFQEVPGCAGCKQFGRDVLSDPAVVDAIEEAFVPLLIHNNTPGPDAETLAAFGEPAWNYQVVRFLNPDGDDLIPRRDRVWETGPLVSRMMAALAVSGSVVPGYLRLTEQEHSDRLQLVHVVQDCFWVGEMQLGQVDGVVATQAAFMGGHEVTSVWFDPDAVAIDQLIVEAQRRRVATAAFVDDEQAGAIAAVGLPVYRVDLNSHRVAPSGDQKRQIRGVSGLDKLSISQLTKVNSFLRSSPDRAAEYLPPSQRKSLGLG